MMIRKIAMLLMAASGAFSGGSVAAGSRDFPVSAAPFTGDIYPDRGTRFPDGVTSLADVVYSVIPGFRPLVVDLYMPRGNAARPLLIYIHGGGWVGGHTRHSGALSDFPRVLAKLASEGFIVASLEYRLSGEAPFPAALQDARAALRFLRANAGKYHIDSTRVGVWGGSAGGHLAALLATTCGDTSLDPVPVAGSAPPSPGSECVQTAVTWYGVFDFAPMVARQGSGSEVKFLGCSGPCDSKAVARASPVTYIGAGDPPFLLIHGEKDGTVDVSQSHLAEARLRAAGVPVTALYIPDVDHSFIGPKPEITRAATLKATNATFDFFHQALDPARK
jgi:acetyl esterase/lipase